MDDLTIFEIPHSTQAMYLGPPSSSPHAKRERVPLASAKTILSAELFQRRHALEYAHLHSDADSWELKAEERILEEERRIGRQRREDLARSLDRSDIKGGTRTRSMDGKLPLSLVQKKEMGHARSRTAVGLGIERLDGLSSVSGGTSRTRTPSLSSGLRPLSLQSSLVTPSVSPRAAHGPDEQTLEVLVEADTSRSSQFDPEIEKSIAPSTYSWATSFSGETSELRTAAHYVPSRAVTPENDYSGPFDSPARREQRRKRIVAIAHTVRQLEGVGSRELEDPTFFETLARAWFERFDKNNAAQQPAKQPSLSSTPNEFGAAFESESESSTMALRRFDESQGTAPGAYDVYGSPPDPEFKTPVTLDEFVAEHQYYPRPSSFAPSMTAQSMRYSYASTLHDLGVEGMMQGAKLMKGRAWMRPTSNSGTPWGGDFEPPSGFRMPSPDEEENDTSWSSSLDSPSEYDHRTPARMLRRIDATIERPIRQRVASDEKGALDSPRKMPSQPDGGTSPAGVGYVNAWWGSTTNSANHSANPTPRSVAHRTRKDFLNGEDGNIPQTLSPLSSQKKRRALSTSSAVLEPANDAKTHLRPTTLSVTLSDQIFLNTLFRIPSRRRSLSLGTPQRQSLPPRLPQPSRTPRRVSDPGARAVESNESVFSNLCQANSHLIRLTTSSFQPPEILSHLSQAKQAALDVQVENQSSEEDGSTGLENLSLRSISPFPTPPLRKDLMHSPTKPVKAQRRPGPLITTFSDPKLFPTSTKPILLAPPMRIQSMQVVTLPTADPTTSPVLTFPMPSVSGRPVLMDLPTEVEEMEADEAYSGIVSPLPRHPMSALTSSARHHTDHWSSPPELPTSASAAIIAELARGQGAQQPGLPSGATRRADEADQLLGAPSRPAPAVTDVMPLALDRPHVAVLPPAPKPGRASTMVLFWLGFICPILWLIGAWQTSSSELDIESRVTTSEKRLEDMSWYRRWTYDRDPYIERCRWAAGVTVPLAIVGGVVAGIVVAIV